MKNIISFFIKNVILVNLFILLIIIFGVISASRLSSSFFPEMDTRFVVINAVYPGASPEEIEEGITLKVEENLEGITGIDRYTSTSTENSANIRVELLPKSDPDEVLQEVKNAVDRINTFPPDMERIVVFKEEMLNFAAKIAVSGDVPLQELKQIAQSMEDDLRDHPQISQINLSGYTEEEIEISVREEMLRNYDLSFESVANAVRQENVSITGGIIRGEEQEIIIRADNKEYYARKFEDIIIKATPDGQRVKLSEIADINASWSEDTDRAYFNDDRVVTITVNTTNEENILKAAEFIRNYIEEFNEDHEVIQATIVEDGTTTLQSRISILEENGILGAILVLFILGFFLRLRMAFWVAIGIPISFLGMFIIAYFVGLTINVLSLFGMILVVGILVDDGVIVGENIYQKHEAGLKPFRAAVNGTIEVLPSVTSAILTTTIAFAIFLFIEGQIGEFFSDVSIVVIASLAISLIEVIFFLPSHLAHSRDMQKGYKPPRWKQKLSDTMFWGRDKLYRPILDFVLRNRLFYFLLILALIILTFTAIGKGVIRTAFFPNIEQNTINVSLEMPAGTPDSITENRINRIKQSANYINENADEKIIEDVEIIVGPGSNAARANIYLVPSDQRNIRSFEIASMLRERTGPIPRANKLSYETQTPFGKPVVVSLSSSDFRELRAAKNDLRAELEKMETLKDVIDTDREDQPELEISLNEKGRLLGLDLVQVISQVRNGFFGLEVQRLQRGINEVKVWVRYDISDRNSVQDLKEMRIRAGRGEAYPLESIADVKLRKGLIAINHLNGDREIRVEADLSSLEVSAPDQVQRIREDILPGILSRYPSVDATFEGQLRETRKISSSLQNAGPIVLILMLAMLVITFKSFTQAFALVSLIPFGVIGAIWGHYIHGLPLSLLSVMGFIALIGILFNDGLVFINTLNQELKEGKPYQEALIDTAMSRFRPLVLTTITTAAGLAPLILESSFQAQFLIPMAVTVAYGLIIGSFLISTLLPILLIVYNRSKVYTRWLWEGEKPRPENVERSVKQKKSEDRNE
jgi:multidrug efflux pump subunit AcrB